MARSPRESNDSGANTPRRVTIARIARPRGIKGEVIADLFTDFPERLSQLKRVFLSPSNGSGAEHEFVVRRCWLHQGRAVFQFEGVETRNAAETLRDMDVQIPLEERVELPAGKFFVSDLVGCEVLEVNEVKEVEEMEEKTSTKDGASFTSFASSTSLTSLGVVRDVDFQAGVPLLVVETSRGELLIPFAEDICRRIDPVGRRIEIVPPEGLLDLNE